MREVFSNSNDITLFLMIFPRMSPHCKLVTQNMKITYLVSLRTFLFVRALVRAFLRVRACVPFCMFVRACVPSFVPACVSSCVFVRACVHAFVRSFIHTPLFPFSRTEEVERNSQLRTRAMREAEKRPSKTYRFTLLRVRFPDGIILQGLYKCLIFFPHFFT